MDLALLLRVSLRLRQSVGWSRFHSLSFPSRHLVDRSDFLASRFARGNVWIWLFFLTNLWTRLFSLSFSLLLRVVLNNLTAFVPYLRVLYNILSLFESFIWGILCLKLFFSYQKPFVTYYLGGFLISFSGRIINSTGLLLTLGGFVTNLGCFH